MHIRRLMLLAFSLVCVGVFSIAASAPAEPGSEPTSLELVRSLAESVRRGWVGRPAGTLIPFIPQYEESWALLQKLSGIPADEAVRLVREEELSLLEGHLVEIAMALKERPTTWPAIEVYYDMAITRGNRTLRGAVSPKPMAAHLRPEFVHAWRWMMLCPASYGTKMARTAAVALARTDDTSSLELMEVLFRWSFERRGLNYGIWLTPGLAAYPEDSRAQALKAAFHCWQYARGLVGQEVMRGTLRARTVSEEETQRVLDSIAAIFPKEAVGQTLGKADGEPEFVEFLEKVRDLQMPKAE